MAISADLVIEARARAGVSQSELARRLGCPRSTILRWEQGSSHPSLEALREAIRACGLDSIPRLSTFDDSHDSLIAPLLAREPGERLRAQAVDADNHDQFWRAGERGQQAPFAPEVLLDALVAEEVPFVLIGRLAACVHGSPVLPGELEAAIALARGDDADAALKRALARLHAAPWAAVGQPPGPPLRQRPHGRDRAFERHVVASAGATLALTREGPRGTRGYGDLVERAEQVDVGTTLVPVASLIDLIRIAGAAGPDWPELPALRRVRELQSSLRHQGLEGGSSETASETSAP